MDKTQLKRHIKVAPLGRESLALIARKFTTPTPEPFALTGGGSPSVAKITWSGEVSSQKWMNFYTRVLSKFATGNGLKLTVKIEVAHDGGVSQQKLEETRSALRELGLNDKLDES